MSKPGAICCDRKSMIGKSSIAQEINKRTERTWRSMYKQDQRFMFIARLSIMNGVFARFIMMLASVDFFGCKILIDLLLAHPECHTGMERNHYGNNDEQDNDNPKSSSRCCQ